MFNLIQQGIISVFLSCLLQYTVSDATVETFPTETKLNWTEAIDRCSLETNEVELRRVKDVLKNQLFWLPEYTALTPWIERIGCSSRIRTHALRVHKVPNEGICQYRCQQHTLFAFHWNEKQCICLDEVSETSLCTTNNVAYTYQVFSKSKIKVPETRDQKKKCLVNFCVNLGKSFTPQFIPKGFFGSSCKSSNNIHFICQNGVSGSYNQNWNEAQRFCSRNNSQLISNFTEFCLQLGFSQGTTQQIWSAHHRLVYPALYSNTDRIDHLVQCKAGNFNSTGHFNKYYQDCSTKLSVLVCKSENGVTIQASTAKGPTIEVTNQKSSIGSTVILHVPRLNESITESPNQSVVKINHHKDMTGQIAGVVIGILAVLGLSLTIAMICRRRHMNKNTLPGKSPKTVLTSKGLSSNETSYDVQTGSAQQDKQFIFYEHADGFENEDAYCESQLGIYDKLGNRISRKPRVTTDNLYDLNLAPVENEYDISVQENRTNDESDLYDHSIGIQNNENEYSVTFNRR